MSLFYDTSIQYLKGVGPKLGQILERKGIATAGELLEHYPRSYEDRRSAREIAGLRSGELVSLVATIMRVSSIPMGKSYRKIYEVVVSDGSGKLACKYFRVPYKGYFERFQPNMKVRVSGKVSEYRGKLQMQHPDIHFYDESEEDGDKILPIYSEIDGIKDGKIRSLIGQVIDKLIDNPAPLSEVDIKIGKSKGVPDAFPDWLIKKYDLMERGEALRSLHLPEQGESLQYIDYKTKAHERIIFEEFFWLELHLARKKKGIQKEKAISLSKASSMVDKIKKDLPFNLTGAQERALTDIFNDLKKSHPMHRLVQGDVGCGKTLVGLLACVHAIENGYQTAFMAPTEILAEQHYKTACKLLNPLGINVSLLIGSLKERQKKEIYEDLSSGKTHLCIGTHALIQDKVEFKSLSLTIVDEQHRFGVDQRSKLKSKAISPHFLVMTATPIPRSLAMTVYGDLDVSIIDEKPAGRTPIITRKAFESKRDKVMGFLADQIIKGRQGYIVYPLVEESEKIELKNAMAEYQKLKKMFPKFRFGLLHGRMKPDEKDAVMREFRDGRTDILVATTVIEVGVDVPNANIMIIEHSERFGLSQLHQLRGRVGRGEHKSYCVLMLGYAMSDVSKLRAEIMESTEDGFKISEKDLEIRGPGEFLGRRQSGLPGFKIANLVRDQKVLQRSKQAAFELIDRDPELKNQEHQYILNILQRNTEFTVG